MEKGNFFKGSLVVLISVLAIFSIVNAGNITPLSGTPTAQFYTLTEIYEFITNSTAATEGGHGFSFSDDLEGTHRTLTEIYDALASLISADQVKSGTTYLGVDGSLVPSGTAAEADCLNSKTFYSGDSWTQKTGNIADCSSEGGNTCYAASGYWTSISGNNVSGTDGSKTFSISDGYYSSKTATCNDTDLVVGNIKSGINIFGVDGDGNVVDTSSGDAIASDILSTKKAWVDGTEITGSASAAGLPDTNQVICYNDTTSCTCGADGCTGVTDWPNQTAQNSEDGNRENDFTVDAAVCGGAGTVYDSRTDLCWEKDASTSGLNWKAALQECNNLSLGGYTDWRLPKASELVSIVDYGYENSSYWHTTKFTNFAAANYWSSTTKPSSTSGAYGLTFGNGYLGNNFKRSTYYAVCVRDN